MLTRGTDDNVDADGYLQNITRFSPYIKEGNYYANGFLTLNPGVSDARIVTG
jgi:hypothetical protein